MIEQIDSIKDVIRITFFNNEVVIFSKKRIPNYYNILVDSLYEVLVFGNLLIYQKNIFGGVIIQNISGQMHEVHGEFNLNSSVTWRKPVFTSPVRIPEFSF